MTLLKIVFKPIKRATGLLLFLVGVAISSITVFPFLFLFFGIDRANDWMDRNVLPFVGWWD